MGKIVIRKKKQPVKANYIDKKAIKKEKDEERGFVGVDTDISSLKDTKSPKGGSAGSLVKPMAPKAQSVKKAKKLKIYRKK